MSFTQPYGYSSFSPAFIHTVRVTSLPLPYFVFLGALPHRHLGKSYTDRCLGAGQTCVSISGDVQGSLLKGSVADGSPCIMSCLLVCLYCKFVCLFRFVFSVFTIAPAPLLVSVNYTCCMCGCFVV